ncbi:GAF domain-containing protein, partial [Sinorhizobium meliloti]
MPSIRDHSERVYRIAHQSSAAVTSPVAASWRRCMTLHGLAPEEARSPWRLSEIEFRQARESSGALIAEAAGELDRLFATVGKAGCCLLLTDGKGVALERRGAGGDDADFRGIGLWSGTVWSEASVGTNGIGTAIADERPVLIQRDQHFLSRNIGLSCATAPIRDESGKLAAAIDISTCRDDASEATLSILSQAVRDAAA